MSMMMPEQQPQQDPGGYGNPDVTELIREALNLVRQATDLTRGDQDSAKLDKISTLLYQCLAEKEKAVDDAMGGASALAKVLR